MGHGVAVIQQVGCEAGGLAIHWTSWNMWCCNGMTLPFFLVPVLASFSAERSLVELLTSCVMKAREEKMAPLSLWDSFSLFFSLLDLLHHLLFIDLWPQLLQSWLL